MCAGLNGARDGLAVLDIQQEQQPVFSDLRRGDRFDQIGGGGGDAVTDALT